MQVRFYNGRMGHEDFKNLIKEMQDSGKYIRPINVESSVNVGYEIGGEKGSVLRFAENHLPLDLDFDGLWNIIQGPTNFKRVMDMGYKPISGNRKDYLVEKAA